MIRKLILDLPMMYTRNYSQKVKVNKRESVNLCVRLLKSIRLYKKVLGNKKAPFGAFSC